MKFQPKLSANSGLFYGDNLYIMQELVNVGFADKFDMIYFDGPFNSGSFFQKFNKDIEEEIVDPWNEATTVRDFFYPDIYRSNYGKRMEVAKKLLNENGILVFHTSQKEGHYLKVILDSVFGPSNFLGEVIWKFSDVPLYKKSQFGLNHETLFFYSKTNNYFKAEQFSFSSIWDDIGKYDNLGDENTFYATQKPEKLIERILNMTTEENALVGDFFCGSGTLPFVAEKMNRKWIASDNSRIAIQTTLSRMAEIDVEVTLHQLVEDFTLSYLHGNEYTKNTDIPFSLNELQGLKSALNNRPVTINAYGYTSEIDLINNDNFKFQFVMPSLDCNGITKKERKILFKDPHHL
jgi:adenine specific DNA methylase Mod